MLCALPQYQLFTYESNQTKQILKLKRLNYGYLGNNNAVSLGMSFLFERERD